MRTSYYSFWAGVSSICLARPYVPPFRKWSWESCDTRKYSGEFSMINWASISHSQGGNWRSEPLCNLFLELLYFWRLFLAPRRPRQILAVKDLFLSLRPTLTLFSFSLNVRVIVRRVIVPRDPVTSLDFLADYLPDFSSLLSRTFLAFLLILRSTFGLDSLGAHFRDSFFTSPPDTTF